MSDIFISYASEDRAKAGLLAGVLEAQGNRDGCLAKPTRWLDAYIPVAEQEVDKAFLMPIEDVFLNSGRGTVVMGRVERGKIVSGSEMEIGGIRPTVKRVVTGVGMREGGRTVGAGTITEIIE